MKNTHLLRLAVELDRLDPARQLVGGRRVRTPPPLGARRHPHGRAVALDEIGGAAVVRRLREQHAHRLAMRIEVVVRRQEGVDQDDLVVGLEPNDWNLGRPVLPRLPRRVRREPPRQLAHRDNDKRAACDVPDRCGSHPDRTKPFGWRKPIMGYRDEGADRCPSHTRRARRSGPVTSPSSRSSRSRATAFHGMRSRTAEISADTAYQIIHDELMLDGNARMNLATFVTTWMEPQAEKLMAECFDKNMIDKDEYPQTAELETRCVNMLSRLWHAPDGRRGDGLLDHRVERGSDARRSRAQAPLAATAGKRRESRRTSPTS